MSRTLLPFAVADVSALARSLRAQLGQCDALPGHLDLLNMLARTAGYKNFQHFRARAKGLEPAQALAPPAPQAPDAAGDQAPGLVPAAFSDVDPARLRRLTRHFDPMGRLVRWPAKHSEQQPCLWVVWSHVPSGRVFSEPDINRCLTPWHLFADPALLRRRMCEQGLLTRTPDCREYRRLEARPSPMALALLERLAARRAQAGNAADAGRSPR